MTPSLRRTLAAVVLLSLAALAGCGGRTRADRVVLITLDTTRADHLGCYGYQNGATPNVDRLAAESTLFEEADSPVPVTLPSHASMFTGLYPAQHGVRYNGSFRLEPSARTLAEILKERGWATTAVPASFAVAKRFGLDQGFDDYQDLFAESDGHSLPPTAERTADDVATRGLRWIAAPRSTPGFLWLHFYDPHHAYRPPFPFSDRFRDRPYDGEIAFMDQEVGRVLDALRADPSAWRRTLVIVAGDHGEGLYEHGEKMHGTLAYQSTLRVPLLIKAPGASRGRRVADPVSLVDLLPTILDYAGIEPLRDISGVSLEPSVRGRTIAPRSLHFEALAGALNYGWSSLEGIRRGSWKLISGVDPELYDLASDPRETSDRGASEETREEDLQQELDETLAGWKAGQPEASAMPRLDAEALERLASLGYVGVGGTSARRAGADPKSLVHLEIEILNVQNGVLDRRWDEVIRSGEFVLRSDPKNRLVLFYMARAHFEAGRPKDALPFAETLAHTYTDFDQGHDLLGLVWRAMGERRKVVEAYQAGAQFVPDSPMLRFRFFLALFDDGQGAKACQEIPQAISRWAEAPIFLLLRARCETLDGSTEAAVSTLREVRKLGLDPRPFVEEEADFRRIVGLPSYTAMLAESPRPK